MITTRQAAHEMSSEIESRLRELIEELERTEHELQVGSPRYFSRGRQNGLRDAQSVVRVFFDRLAETLPNE